MKNTLLSLSLIVSISAFSQNFTEFIYNGNAALHDVEKAEYFEVDFLYSSGFVIQNSMAIPLINKTDISGNLYWSKKIEIPDSQAMAGDLCVVSEDEIYILCFGLMRMNGDGDIVFHKSIESTSSLNLRTIAKTPDNHLLVCGNPNDDVILLKFDTAGNLVNHVRLGTDRDEIIRDISVDQDGNIVLVGASAPPFTNVNTKGLIMKLDQDLNLLWSKTIHRESDQDDDYFSNASSCVNNGTNTILVMEATGDIQPEVESSWQDIGIVNLNSLGEIESENMIDIGLYEQPTDLLRSSEGDLTVTGTVFTSPDEFYSSFVLSLDAQFQPIAANHHFKDSEDLLMYSSAIITENPTRIATVGETTINQNYKALQTHHSVESGLCSAYEMTPTAYEPDFIIEDIAMETYEQELVISDLKFEVTNAFSGISANCSATLSDGLSSGSDEISLFPNPCNQNFQISGIDQLTPIRLTDVRGKIIKEISYRTGLIDISDLSQGIYLVEVPGEKFLRLIKQ